MTRVERRDKQVPNALGRVAMLEQSSSWVGYPDDPLLEKEK
jgi:hypothetical protein